VIQYTEIIHPAFDPSKDVPVVYSQGNLTPVLSNPASVLSMLVRFRISRTEGAAKVTGMELLPVALVERVAGEGSQLELKELKKLTAMQAELEEPMQDYVVQMSDYADEVLGPTWRE
jgi:hypothetical protein